MCWFVERILIYMSVAETWNSHGRRKSLQTTAIELKKDCGSANCVRDLCNRQPTHKNRRNTARVPYHSIHWLNFPRWHYTMERMKIEQKCVGVVRVICSADCLEFEYAKQRNHWRTEAKSLGVESNHRLFHHSSHKFIFHLLYHSRFKWKNRFFAFLPPFLRTTICFFFFSIHIYFPSGTSAASLPYGIRIAITSFVRRAHVIVCLDWDWIFN